MSYNYFTPNYFGGVDATVAGVVIEEAIKIEIEYDEIEIIVEVE